jgi:hypothetical protein
MAQRDRALVSFEALETIGGTGLYSSAIKFRIQFMPLYNYARALTVNQDLHMQRVALGVAGRHLRSGIRGHRRKEFPNAP